jgi:hypothetical protein
MPALNNPQLCLMVNPLTERVGLCAKCLHMRMVQSSKGNTFYLCQLSQIDMRFNKYPRLPVLECEGYQPKPNSAEHKNLRR